MKVVYAIIITLISSIAGTLSGCPLCIGTLELNSPPFFHDTHEFNQESHSKQAENETEQPERTTQEEV